MQHQGPQANHPGGRKSQGSVEVCVPIVTESASQTSASQTALERENGLSNEGAEGMGTLEKEPSLKDILLAVSNCKTSLSDLSDQLRGIRDDLFSLKQDMQEVCAWTTVLEGRLSQVEDDVNLMRQEVKIMKEQLEMCMRKMDEFENRARRKNVRVLGLPERSEGNNPTEYMEGWFRDMFGKDCLSKFFAIERAHRVAYRAPILQKAREMRGGEMGRLGIGVCIRL